MPELTNSSVGSLPGTSELEGTMLCPFERKYSRKLERISLDFMTLILLGKKPGRRGRPGTPLGVDASVLQQPGANRAHGALVRRGQLLQRAAGVEAGEQLAVFVLAPRLARLRRQLELSPLEALHALERRRRLVKRAHHQRTLVGALRRKHFTRLRIDAVRERAHDCQCLCLFHCVHLLSTETTCSEINAHGTPRTTALRKKDAQLNRSSCRITSNEKPRLCRKRARRAVSSRVPAMPRYLRARICLALSRSPSCETCATTPCAARSWRMRAAPYLRASQ